MNSCVLTLCKDDNSDPLNKDGDLCEQYALLDPSKQKSIAEELDRTPSEVLKKLEDIRNMIL